MHELAVAQALLELASRHATAAGARRVVELRVVAGDLAGFASDALRTCWLEVARGTACEGSRLSIESVPARFQCRDCDGRYPLAAGELTPCPTCGGRDVRIVGGEEFRLDAIVVELPLGQREAPR